MTEYNDLFLRACRREKTERVPVWFMRQAGRYDPDYRKIKENIRCWKFARSRSWPRK